MENIIFENRIDWSTYTFKPSKEFTTRDGRKFKKIYLIGRYTKLNDELLANGKKKIQYQYRGIKKEEVGKNWLHYTFINPEEDGSYDYSKIKPKFEPLLNDLTNIYNVTVDIDKMIDDLTNGTPDEEDDDQPTEEEVKNSNDSLESFKENILNLASSEELFEKIKLMSDIKQAEGSANFSKLTPNNLWRVYAVKPDATIVMNKKDWKDLFNRTVNDDATRIVINRGGKVPAAFRKAFEAQWISSKHPGKKYGDLSGLDKKKMNIALYKANEKQAKEEGRQVQFSHSTYYDYSDTTQIEGTEDIITPEVEKIRNTRISAEEAKERLKALGGLEATQPNTTKSEKITLVYNGLMDYKKDQSINLPNYQEKENPTAGETKQLSSVIFSKILHEGNFPGAQNNFANRFYLGTEGGKVRAAQSEMASWMFMHGMGIEFKPTQVKQSVIFSGEDIKTQKNHMNVVMKQVEGAVLHLKDFVEVYIEDNQLSEGVGGINFDMPSRAEVAKEFGFTDLLNYKPDSDASSEEEIQELYESITRKLKRRL